MNDRAELLSMIEAGDRTNAVTMGVATRKEFNARFVRATSTGKRTVRLPGNPITTGVSRQMRLTITRETRRGARTWKSYCAAGLRKYSYLRDADAPSAPAKYR